MSVSDAVGYIVYYNGGEAVLIEGQDSTNYTLEGLALENIYTVHVISYLYNYTDIFKEESTGVVVIFDGKQTQYKSQYLLLLTLVLIITVPSILSLDIQKINTTSILTSWDTVNSSIVDNYTVTVTRLCDNVVLSPVNVIDGNLSSILIDGLLSGSQYRVSLIPVNILGEGMEITEDVTIDVKGTMF